VAGELTAVSALRSARAVGGEVPAGAVADHLEEPPAVPVGDQRDAELIAHATSFVDLTPPGAAQQVAAGDLTEHRGRRPTTAGRGQHPVRAVRSAVLQVDEAHDVGGRWTVANPGRQQQGLRVDTCPAPSIERHRAAKYRHDVLAQGPGVGVPVLGQFQQPLAHADGP
jgi:hypothetical protein